jgi:GDP-L-fucose synthase
MKKVLITGSNGFIGRNLVECLRGKYEICCPSSKALDLREEQAVQMYLEQHQFDVVIHSARQNRTPRKIIPYDLLEGNLRMFFNLERCHDLYGKMIYFGSYAEYDKEHEMRNVSEDYIDTYVPREPYGFSKYVMAKACEKQKNITELCLFGVYGKYEEWQRRFISNNIIRSIKGYPMLLSQNAMFDYLYVNDLSKIIEWFMEHEPKQKHYNICSGKTVDLLSIAQMINEVSGQDREIRVAKEGWQLEYSGNNSRLLDEMGAFSFADLKSTIKEMWNYYAEHIDEQQMLV